MKPYTAGTLILDHEEDGRIGNRKTFDLEHAEEMWRGREWELRRERQDAKRKGHEFTAFCAGRVLKRLGA